MTRRRRSRLAALWFVAVWRFRPIWLALRHAFAPRWAVHILGPDSLTAQPSESAADARASEWNEMFAKLNARDPSPHNPLVYALTVPWPHSLRSHAAALAEHGGDPEDIC